ncbi:MAG: TolC family outer membrane protein, partial [Alphaproteobacteria bacterium]
SEEVRLGARTTLDLLDAEQDLLSAKSTLASAQRDEYVAGLNLLSSMGLLTVENLALGIPAYDPAVNFDRVTRSPFSSFSGSSILDNISDRWK